jgi:hypothetical protein
VLFNDADMQVTRECLLLLRMFMELWLNVLQEQRLSSSFINPAAAAGSASSRQLEAQRLLASSSQEDASGAAAVAAASFGTDAPECADPACFTLDLHRLEGVFFMLLCSFDEAIRLEACSALGVLRTLHQQLYTMAEELGLQQQQRSSGDALQLQPPAAPSQLASPGMAAAGAVGGSFSSVGTPTAAAAAAAGGAADSAAAAATPPASSVASGSGMFFRHKATASRDSAEFMQTLGRSC